jgi:hypothetical protein
LGYPDGNKLPLERQAQLASDLVKAVKVPVSIDMEAGYSDDPELVGENLKLVLYAGIAGINIEDGTGEPSLLAKKIEAIKRAASAMKVDVFVNARTDVYFQNFGLGRKQGRRDSCASGPLQRRGSRWSLCPGVDRIDADRPEHRRNKASRKPSRAA